MSLIKLLIDKWRNVKPLAVLDSIKWTALLMKFFLTDDYHKIRHSGTCTILRVLTMSLYHKITYSGTCTILEFWQCFCTTKSHSVEHVQFSQFWQCLRLVVHILYLVCYPLANEVTKGYSNATVLPSLTSLWTL